MITTFGAYKWLGHGLLEPSKYIIIINSLYFVIIEGSPRHYPATPRLRQGPGAEGHHNKIIEILVGTF